jgi:Nucleotidyl transferase AbiEii toxin, Type IV TA system
LIPSPIRKALSTIRKHQVAHLLMGGQACVLYGAAEFSRDLDLALLPDPNNLDRLSAALDELEAEVIAVPPLALEHLTEGLAVHFRCRQAEAAGLRIDIMTRMRGVAPFPDLWARRTTLDFGDETLDVLSLPDLVAAKKTQRDKDWPMIRRLVDVNYLNHRDEPTPERLRFWLRELRTPELLVEAARAHADIAAELSGERPLLTLAQAEHLESGALGRALRAEEDAERRLDEAYWKPLREHLERLRRARMKGDGQ